MKQLSSLTTFLLLAQIQPLCSMEEYGSRGLYRVTHPIIISSDEDLMRYHQMKGRSDSNVPAKVEFTPEFMALCASRQTFETDSPSRMNKPLTDRFHQMYRDDPRAFDAHAQRFLVESDKYGGDLSATSRKERRRQKFSDSNTSSLRSSPKDQESDSPTPKKIQLTIKKQGDRILDEIEDQNYEMRKIKQQMRELTLQAAENALKEKEGEADRNKYVGIITTTVTTIAGPLVTYFITNGTCTNGTTPTPAPTNTTG